MYKLFSLVHYTNDNCFYFLSTPMQHFCLALFRQTLIVEMSMISRNFVTKWLSVLTFRTMNFLIGALSINTPFRIHNVQNFIEGIKDTPDCRGIIWEGPRPSPAVHRAVRSRHPELEAANATVKALNLISATYHRHENIVSRKGAKETFSEWGRCARSGRWCRRRSTSRARKRKKQNTKLWP